MITEATINVSPFGKGVRVRASFFRKIFNNQGVTVASQELDDPLFYQHFFAKVDKSLFIQRQGI
jgi:hypothetical protein